MGYMKEKQQRKGGESHVEIKLLLRKGIKYRDGDIPVNFRNVSDAQRCYVSSCDRSALGGAGLDSFAVFFLRTTG